MKEFNQAFLAAQTEMPNLKKSSSNPHFKSKFADFVELTDKVRPVLNKHGLYFTHTVGNDESDRIVVTCFLIHAESNQQITSSVSWRPEKDTAQSIGSLITYMKRYTLQALCGVSADDEDDDGNAAGERRPLTKYIGAPEQKRLLVEKCRQLGIKDSKVMGDINAKLHGVDMSQVDSVISQILKQ
jgi:hypothetical protein